MTEQNIEKSHKIRDISIAAGGGTGLTALWLEKRRRNKLSGYIKEIANARRGIIKFNKTKKALAKVEDNIKRKAFRFQPSYYKSLIKRRELLEKGLTALKPTLNTRGEVKRLIGLAKKYRGKPYYRGLGKLILSTRTKV